MSLLCQFFVQLIEVDDLHVQLEKVTTEISTKFQEHVVVVDAPLQLHALKVILQVFSMDYSLVDVTLQSDLGLCQKLGLLVGPIGHMLLVT